jgi:hypothetical protein
MSLQFFCLALPHPIWNPLKQSQPRRRQIQSILKLWPPSETAVQKCSACSAVHPSNWPFAKQATGIFRPIVPQKFRTDIFFHFHNISHLEKLASRRTVSSRYVWRVFATNITAWPKPASTACRPRFIATRACSRSQSPIL